MTRILRPRVGAAIVIVAALLLGGCAAASPVVDATHSAPVVDIRGEHVVADGSASSSLQGVQGAVAASGAVGPLVFSDDFARTTLGTQWAAYTGRPSSDSRVQWARSQVSVNGSALVLTGTPQASGMWLTGGVSNWRSAQTYGRWEIRFRATASEALSYHFLLWPQSERWPPEIDIAEGFTANRSRSDAFVHWLDDAGDRQRNAFSVAGNFTVWNTVSVDWTADAIVFALNGVEYGRVTGDAVPHEPMFIALQTETQIGGSPTTGTHRVEIDWVRIYAAAAPTPTPTPTATPSATPFPTPSALPAMPSCEEMMPRHAMYAIQPLWAALSSPVPTTGTVTETQNASGRVCTWMHETTSQLLFVTAAALEAYEFDPVSPSGGWSPDPGATGAVGAQVWGRIESGAVEARVVQNGLVLTVRTFYAFEAQDLAPYLVAVLDSLDS